ncbi:MAG: bifunctional methylenetetrahydrofolate dehydrogenase/methenyltetrahydrofolate cyclohydrolase FolD [Deltaproteobacteria bacterium]|nr:bifunctional methylenetetrahydrofolate dehydrogenase/methenyltetrahydrofolate cyclohydrolase FolD [Deltaproteobacteria bacterium]
MARIIDGKMIAQKVRDGVREDVKRLRDRGLEPCLAVVLAGNDPASEIYVRNKQKACEEAGIRSIKFAPHQDAPEQEILSLVESLNNDPLVHGILVQMPLPKQINPRKVIEMISPEKDVDGFHPVNMGYLLAGRQRLVPCTPLGVMYMIDHEGIEIQGKRAVIVGRSDIVGKPAALLFLHRHATVTVCHSRTKDLPGVVREGDIVVAAIGKREFLKGDWIKHGAVVIDVGINRGEDGKLKGDVEFESAAERASFITPVPGGVGPMTIAMLLCNLLKCVELNSNI